MSGPLVYAWLVGDLVLSVAALAVSLLGLRKAGGQ